MDTYNMSSALAEIPGFFVDVSLHERVCSWHHIKPCFIEGSLIYIRLLWAQLLSHGCKCGNNLL